MRSGGNVELNCGEGIESWKTQDVSLNTISAVGRADGESQRTRRGLEKSKLPFALIEEN
jgi:hypothetical protein